MAERISGLENDSKISRIANTPADLTTEETTDNAVKFGGSSSDKNADELNNITDLAKTLPDITLPTIEFDDFHGRETVADSSSSNNSFSMPFADREGRHDYPLVGYPVNGLQHVDFNRILSREQAFYPHYNVSDQVIPECGYNEEPQRFRQRGAHVNQHQWPIHEQKFHRYGQMNQLPSDQALQPCYNSPLQQVSAPNSSIDLQKRIDADGVGIPPVTRYCCGLFRTRKYCRMVCVPIFVILAIAAGLLIYFFYPHTLNIKMTTSLYQTGNAILSGDFKRSNMNLKMQLFGNFSAHSPNHIPYPAHISVTGSLINPNGKSPARIGGRISTSLKAEKQVYTSPGENSFQILLQYTYTQSSVNYTKNLLRQANFKEVDGDLQSLYLSCAPELIGVLPYPNRKPRTLTVILDWRVEVSINGLLGGEERDLECPEGIMGMLKQISESLT